MMDSVDFVDGMDTEKTHLLGEVHSVHNVHSVHYLDKSNWLKLPNPGSGIPSSRRKERQDASCAPERWRGELRIVPRVNPSKGNARQTPRTRKLE